MSGAVPASCAELRWGPAAAAGAPAASAPSAAQMERVAHVRIAAPPPGQLPAEMAPLLAQFPNLHAVRFRVTGRLPPDRTAQLYRLAAEVAPLYSRFEVELVVPTDADPAGWLGSKSTTLDDLVSATRQLRAAAIPVRWVIPLVPDLIYRLEGLHVVARSVDAETALIAAPPPQTSASNIDENDRRFARDFVLHRPADDGLLRWSACQRRGTLVLIDAVCPGNCDSLDHPLLRFNVDPAPPGLLHGAHLVRAPGPAPDTGQVPRHRVSVANRVAHAFDAATVILSGARGVLAWIGSGVTSRIFGSRGTQDRAPLPRVMIIGAYGGDHIGDAAILGGVLLRIHKRHGTRAAIVMSQRADHTRHLVRMLDVPVEVAVEEYDRSTVTAALSRVDGVVYAGGPLMDLPKQLVLHLHAVTRARRRRQPFVIDGIGAGPFFRSASAWVARRLVRMADRVTVRTTADASKPLVRGLAVEVHQDPAFDYLATRSPQSSRLSDRDRAGIRTLLTGVDGRMVIGLNLRPIRHEFTPGAGMDERLAYTRLVEGRFEQRLAEALVRFHDASEAAPCVVFFPMNAIQFGMSDLRSAYRIQQLLPQRVDFRIWEADAGLDAVVSLMRRLDVVIAMRFHAAIFALSQGRPTIGIEYRIGRKDKVTGLLADANMSANCAGIETMTADWLYSRLSSLAVDGAAGGFPAAQPV